MADITVLGLKSENETPRSKPVSMFEKILKICSLSLLAVFLVLFFFRPIETEDVWWHLSTGQWIAAHHDIPKYDVFNCTDEKIPWFPVHWLGSLTLYGIYQFGGLLGLKIFRAIFFLFILSIFIYKSRKNLPPPFLITLILLLAFGLDYRILLRPLIFNFVFIQIYLIILSHHLCDEKSKWIFFIPLLSGLWFNIHLGVFVYGTIILGTFLFADIVELVGHGSKAVKNEAWLLQRKIRELILVIIGHFGAFFINPFGIAGALFPFRAIIDPNSINQKFFFSNVIEMTPPVHILSGAGWWFFPLVISVIFCIKFNNKIKFAELLLFIVSLFSFIYSARSIELFLCTGMFILWRSLPNLDLKKRWAGLTDSKRAGPILYALLILFLTVNIYVLLQRAAVIDNQLKKEISLDLSPYNPTAALEFLDQHKIQGVALAWEGYGGSILWSSYPRIKPLADGRQINVKAYLDYLRITSSPEKYWDIMQSRYGFTIAILDTNFGTLNKTIDYLVKNPRWKMVFLKGACIVFIKTDAYPLYRQIKDFQAGLKNTSPRLTELAQVLKQPALDNLSSLKRMTGELVVYSEPQEEGLLLYTTGFKAAGLNRLIDAYLVTPTVKLKKILSLISEDFLNP